MLTLWRRRRGSCAVGAARTRPSLSRVGGREAGWRRGGGRAAQDEQEDAGGTKTRRLLILFEVANWSSSPESAAAVFDAVLRVQQRGLGNARVAERMRDALRCETAADVAALVDRAAGDVERVASRIVAATGVTLATATRAPRMPRAACATSRRGSADGFRKKSVGVHFSLYDVGRSPRGPDRRRSSSPPPAAAPTIEPVRVGERRAFRTRWMPTMAAETSPSASGTSARTKTTRTATKALFETAKKMVTRWPKTLVASRGGFRTRRWFRVAARFLHRSAPGPEASRVAETRSWRRRRRCSRPRRRARSFGIVVETRARRDGY